jgi:hypothetical protein
VFEGGMRVSLSQFASNLFLSCAVRLGVDERWFPFLAFKNRSSQPTQQFFLH